MENNPPVSGPGGGTMLYPKLLSVETLSGGSDSEAVTGL
jgi:hypothetical protein